MTTPWERAVAAAVREDCRRNGHPADAPEVLAAYHAGLVISDYRAKIDRDVRALLSFAAAEIREAGTESSVKTGDQEWTRLDVLSELASEREKAAEEGR